MSYATPAPPPDTPTLTCAWGARYRDYPSSYAAYRAVFGHRPAASPADHHAQPQPDTTSGAEGSEGEN